MKKALVILFLFSFLSANTAFGEILKLPLLIHHYIEHSQEDNDNSVMDFLAKHYGKDINHHHDDSHHDHENLPFKTSNTHTVQMVSFQPLLIQFSKKSSVEDKLKTPIRQQQNYSNAYLNSIWQPPKIS